MVAEPLSPIPSQPWLKVKQNDPRALALANRHYSRVKPGSKSFMPPARQCVLLSQDEQAVFGMSWPYPAIATHGLGDLWLCTIFRNESSVLSSYLIRLALRACYDWWAAWPTDGTATYVDEHKTRKKRDPGRCFRKVGYSPIGHNKSGLLVLHMPLTVLHTVVEGDSRHG